jgi:hypothetical protein
MMSKRKFRVVAALKKAGIGVGLLEDKTREARLLKVEAGGARSDEFLEALPGSVGYETSIDRSEPFWQNR